MRRASMAGVTAPPPVHAGLVAITYRAATGAVAASSWRQLVSLLHAASPRMNLDVTADDSCLHPHVSCVKTSHPAAQLDVNPEQRSVRQSMMSGPHHGDRAHIHTTFGAPRKFIRASSSRSTVAGCLLNELHARGQAKLGVDVGEVGLHGAR